MALSLKDLREVMAPLSELGKGESTFDVNGLQITVRNLSPAEEIEAQRYARVALTEGDANDQINGLDFLDRFRMICLGYAIVQIGSTDFRGVETIETGEKLPNGVAVNIKKYEAIIEVMKSWSRPMTVAVFQRFTDHMEDIEERVEKSLAYSDDHIDGQISRVEEKLNDLRSRKAKTTLAGNDPRKEVLGVAANKPTKPVESAPAEGEPETWETVRERRISTDEDALSVEIPNEMPKGVIEEGEETKVSVEPPKSEAPRRSVFGDARPVDEVVESLARLGFDPAAMLPIMRRQDAKLDQIEKRVPGVLSVRFADLENEATCKQVFEHCLPYKHDPEWWATIAPVNIQIDMRALVRYAVAYREPMEKLARHAKQSMLANLARKPAHEPDGITFQQERFADWYRDAQPLFKEHMLTTGQDIEDFRKKNIPLLQALDDLGFMQVTTARCNGRMFGYAIGWTGPGGCSGPSPR